MARQRSPSQIPELSLSLEYASACEITSLPAKFLLHFFACLYSMRPVVRETEKPSNVVLSFGSWRDSCQHNAPVFSCETPPVDVSPARTRAYLIAEGCDQSNGGS